MAQGSYGLSVNIGGVAIQKSIVRTGDHPNPYEVTLDAAKAVTGWTQTNASVANCTLPNSHGYTNGTFDVYWNTSARFDCAGSITNNVISFANGSGDNFPATNTTGVSVCKQTQINTAIDGDAIAIAALSLEYTDATVDSQGRLLFEDGAGDDIASIELTGNSPLVYDVEGGQTNPFAGDPITVCRASHQNTDSAATLKIVSLEDASP